MVFDEPFLQTPTVTLRPETPADPVTPHEITAPQARIKVISSRILFMAIVFAKIGKE